MSARIGAVVLAAGMSRRMGAPKLLLPWGKVTVIEQVALTLSQAEQDLEMVVVAGKLKDEIRAALSPGHRSQVMYNPEYEQGEMLSSLKIGLGALMGGPADAALVVLGDQPQMQVEIVRQVIAAYRDTGKRLVIPSYQMRRGHPWLVDRSLWRDLLNLKPGETMRTFISRCEDEILYVEVNTPSVLKDLDTPEDYQAEKPPDRL